jgi:hypothetical protein
MDSAKIPGKYADSVEHFDAPHEALQAVKRYLFTVFYCN